MARVVPLSTLKQSATPSILKASKRKRSAVPNTSTVPPADGAGAPAPAPHVLHEHEIDTMSEPKRVSLSVDDLLQISERSEISRARARVNTIVGLTGSEYFRKNMEHDPHIVTLLMNKYMSYLQRIKIEYCDVKTYLTYILTKNNIAQYRELFVLYSPIVYNFFYSFVFRNTIKDICIFTNTYISYKYKLDICAVSQTLHKQNVIKQLIAQIIPYFKTCVNKFSKLASTNEIIFKEKLKKLSKLDFLRFFYYSKYYAKYIILKNLSIHGCNFNKCIISTLTYINQIMTKTQLFEQIKQEHDKTAQPSIMHVIHELNFNNLSIDLFLSIIPNNNLIEMSDMFKHLIMYDISILSRDIISEIISEIVPISSFKELVKHGFDSSKCDVDLTKLEKIANLTKT